MSNRLVELTEAEMDTLRSSLEIHEFSLSPCDPDCECILHPLQALMARLEAIPVARAFR